MKKLLFIGLMLSLLTACASLQQMQQNYTASICTENAAYAAGVNSGKANQPMRSSYNSSCSANLQASLNAAYRSGYQFGLSQFSQQRSGTNISINTTSGRSAQKQCLRNMFNNEVCGYGCIKSRMNDVRCASRPGDRCVQNSFGNVKCGRNCRVDDFSNIRCDSES